MCLTRSTGLNRSLKALALLLASAPMDLAISMFPFMVTGAPGTAYRTRTLEELMDLLLLAVNRLRHPPRP